jgi:hypothetical protein
MNLGLGDGSVVPLDAGEESAEWLRSELPTNATPVPSARSKM